MQEFVTAEVEVTEAFLMCKECCAPTPHVYRTSKVRPMDTDLVTLYHLFVCKTCKTERIWGCDL